ncbi:M48 family metalloprotease [bacterium]|nr:M48 family metalloprotease [bacterium]
MFIASAFLGAVSELAFASPTTGNHFQLDKENPWAAIISRTVTNLFPNSKFKWIENKSNQDSIAELEITEPLLPAISIKLKVMNSGPVNAFAMPANSAEEGSAQIILPQAILETISSTSELAFVLTHELSHIVRDHFAPELPLAMLTESQRLHISKTHRNWELQADSDAKFYLEQRGFDTSAGAKLLANIHDEATNSPTANHPTLDHRIAALAQELLPLRLK